MPRRKPIRDHLPRPKPDGGLTDGGFLIAVDRAGQFPNLSRGSYDQ